LPLGFWRVGMRVPGEVAVVSWEAIEQLITPKRTRGAFRAVTFEAEGADDARDAGRRAIAEAFGSFTPNTIVIGIDQDRNLLLVHQLRKQGGREEVDPLRLG